MRNYIYRLIQSRFCNWPTWLTTGMADITQRYKISSKYDYWFMKYKKESIYGFT
jgi:hypothetical protein